MLTGVPFDPIASIAIHAPWLHGPERPFNPNPRRTAFLSQ
jgi:hypothetical protein